MDIIANLQTPYSAVPILAQSAAPLIAWTPELKPLHGCWQKKKKLGQGGCGTVSLAFDNNSGREFVVKSVVCAPGIHREPNPESDLDNEFSVLQKVRGCPHALECLGSDIDVDEEGHPVKLLFLEYMDGGSLLDVVMECHAAVQSRINDHDKLKTKGASTQLLCEDHIQFFTRAILEGMEELHQRGVVHSDIKCANVLLRHRKSSPNLLDAHLVQSKSATGHHHSLMLKKKSDKRKLAKVEEGVDFEVKLGDFGVSREYDPTFGLIANGGGANGQIRMRGTISHMAPEVVQGRGAGPASDVWSLGCTVVEMLQGTGPWGNIGKEALLRQAMDEPPHLPHHVSKLCKDFLQHCLVREPNARWTPSQLLHHPFLHIQHPTHHHNKAISLPTLITTVKKPLGELGRANHHHDHVGHTTTGSRHRQHVDHADHAIAPTHSTANAAGQQVEHVHLHHMRRWIDKLLHHHHHHCTHVNATSCLTSPTLFSSCTAAANSLSHHQLKYMPTSQHREYGVVSN